MSAQSKSVNESVTHCGKKREPNLHDEVLGVARGKSETSLCNADEMSNLWEDVVEKEFRLGVPLYFVWPWDQPRESLKFSLNAGDVHIVSLFEGMEGLLVPSKIYGIMASGRPVIFIGAKAGEIGEIVKNARGGYVVSESDAPQLVKYLALLEHLPEMGKKLGENNRNAFEKLYDRPLALQKFESILNALK